MNIRITRSAQEMDTIAAIWGDLLERQRHTLFQTFSWNQLAAEVFCDRMTPHVVCVETDAGAAIIPAVINHAANRMELFGEALFDYRDVLHAGDPEVLHAAWQQVAACGLPFAVTAVSDEAAIARWEDFPLASFAGAPYVDRRVTNEHQFRAAHPRLGRRFRQLQKNGVELRAHSGAETDLIRRLYDLKSAQFAGPGNVLKDERRRNFLISAAGLEISRCEVFTLESNGPELLAGLVTFRDGNIRRFYTIYFDAAWARNSPGVLLMYEVTARSLAAGLSCDYMTGEQPYKMRLATSTNRLFRVEINAGHLAEIASKELRSSAA